MLSLLEEYADRDIIFFDGVCSLCSGWINFLRRRRTKVDFYFCAVQSPAGQQFLTELRLPTDAFETMIYLKQGKPFYKSMAIIQVLSQLDAPWSYILVLRFLPEQIRDGLYDSLARNRYTLGRMRASCYVPNESDQHQFIESIDR